MIKRIRLFAQSFSSDDGCRHRSGSRLIRIPDRLVVLISLPLLLILSGTTNLIAQETVQIFASDSKPEQLFSGGFWLEGPAVAPDGTVYFSDITYTSLSGMQAGHIWRYDPRTGTTSIFRSPSGMSNGITFDARGDMLVAEGADFGGRRIIRTGANLLSYPLPRPQ